MELRHLRYFVVVAEELNFSRAAERLHIEQSPLSRAIRELEAHLKTPLFIRDRRRTRLTWAGEVFLKDTKRLLALLEQAQSNVKAAASGFRGSLRVALSDGVSPQRLAALLALCREQEPDVEIRLFEVPLRDQLKGLRNDLYDVGFSRSAEAGKGIVAREVWCDELVIVVPTRHQLLAYRRIPLQEALSHPLILARQDLYEGWHRQVARIIHAAEIEPHVAEYVATFETMMALISAGYGIGFASASRVGSVHSSDKLVKRPLAGQYTPIKKYLMMAADSKSEKLTRFSERASDLLCASPVL